MASDVMDTGDPDHDYPRDAAHRRPVLNSKAGSTSSKDSLSPYPHLLRLPHSKPRNSDPLAPQRTTQQLRRHRSYTALPIDSLARKLSKQSLRHQDSHNTIRRRPSSIDLHRQPPLRSDLASNFPLGSGQRKDIVSGEKPATLPPSIAHPSAPDSIVCQDDRPGQTLPRQNSFGELRSTNSPIHVESTIHWRAVPASVDIGSPHTMRNSSGGDEGYCEGDDDLSWLDNDDAATLGLAGHLRRRGLLRYRSSQEAAMQCSTKLVRNEPRMRRRRKQKERRLSSATNASQATDLLSSSISQLPSLASSPP